MNQTSDKEDRLLLAAADDKLSVCLDRSIMTHTDFLDSRQSALLLSHFKALGIRPVLYGGYTDAERRIAVFLPDYMTAEDLYSEDGPLSVLHVTVPKGSKPLSHRDYLGSLLATGIKREVAGDILVGEDQADIVILKDMEDFLLSSYAQAGRASLTCSVLPVSSLAAVEQKTEDMRDSVASVRLDAVCASAFRLSRGKAQEAIGQGLVSVNGLQCLKPDYQPAAGDRITMRGKGKAVLTEVGGTRRKGRIYILIKKYI